MSTYTAKCDICGTENTVASYGDWACRQCGQGYTYDECHQIRLTDSQWALLRNPPRWIPVSERLPGEGEQVIVWMPDCPHHPCGGIDMGSCMAGSWGVSWMVSEGRSAFPSHWMPLPEPPST